jgi:hypothetical protein
MELSLDTVQPKVMQQEQTIKLKAKSKTAHAKVAEEGQATAFMAKQKYWGSSGADKGSSRELRPTPTRGLVTSVARLVTLS